MLPPASKPRRMRQKQNAVPSPPRGRPSPHRAASFGSRPQHGSPSSPPRTSPAGSSRRASFVGTVSSGLSSSLSPIRVAPPPPERSPWRRNTTAAASQRQPQLQTPPPPSHRAHHTATADADFREASASHTFVVERPLTPRRAVTPTVVSAPSGIASSSPSSSFFHRPAPSSSALLRECNQNSSNALFDWSAVAPSEVATSMRGGGNSRDASPSRWAPPPHQPLSGGSLPLVSLVPHKSLSMSLSSSASQAGGDGIVTTPLRQTSSSPSFSSPQQLLPPWWEVVMTAPCTVQEAPPEFNHKTTPTAADPFVGWCVAVASVVARTATPVRAGTPTSRPRGVS